LRRCRSPSEQRAACGLLAERRIPQAARGVAGSCLGWQGLGRGGSHGRVLPASCPVGLAARYRSGAKPAPS